MRPGFLGERDEDLGRDAAVLGVVPAQERLGADDGVVGEPHDRLVVQAQQAVLQRVAQRAFERVLAQAVLGEVGVQELERVAAELLRVIHRDVRVLQELLGIVRIVGIDADADRGRHVDVVLLDLERLGDGVEQLPRDPSQHRGLVEVLDDDHELVAAEPGQEVGVAQRGGERRAHALQELVADPVAERVVDVLEAVEVDEQHADAAAAALRLRDRLREPLVQQQAVGQSGQRVARGHVLQAFLGLDPQRHVLHERQDRHDVAAVVEQARVVPLAPDRLPALAAVPREAGGARLLAAHEARQELGDGAAVFVVQQRIAVDRHAQHFLGAPAEELLGLRRPAHEAVVAVPLQHGERRVVDVRGQHPVGAARARPRCASGRARPCARRRCR